jgi:type IV secretory pathway VirB4 component
MATKRMRGKDYRKEFNEIEKRKSSLYAHAIQRLEFLIDKYPLASVENGKEEARYLQSRFKREIEGDIVWTLTTRDIIQFIEEIEKWSSARQKAKQLKIDEIYIEARDMMDKVLKRLDD